MFGQGQKLTQGSLKASGKKKRENANSQWDKTSMSEAFGDDVLLSK